MGDPKPLSKLGAAIIRFRHRRDWTFDPDAAAGDGAIKVRRKRPPEVTSTIRRLQRQGTGGWEGGRPLDRQSGRLVIAILAGRCVGYAYGTDHLAGPPDSCLLDDVVVEEALRCRGIGHSVISELSRWFVEDGYTEIWGLPRGQSAAPGGLGVWYQRMGFELGVDRGLMRAELATIVNRTSPSQTPPR